MIVFAWEGFPQYAARCVGAFVKATNESVVVVATRPAVPIKGMEVLCGCPVTWIDDGPIKLGKIDTLFVSGWGIPAFNRLRDEVRVNGGRVIGLVDNNFIFSFKEILRAIRFRLFIRRHYDAFMVPGKSGRKLLRFYGVPDGKIKEGLYAADDTLFTPGPPLEKRPKKIIYVGQFCARKNVLRMCRAFLNAKLDGWALVLYGSGPLKEELEGISSNAREGVDGTIEVHGFLQPEELAAKYREARFFLLPSIEEHWGLVVHEAALSGCLLLLSKYIGAADDFLVAGENGWLFDPFDVDDMTCAIKRTMELDDVTMADMRLKSLQLSHNASLNKFVGVVRTIVG